MKREINFYTKEPWLFRLFGFKAPIKFLKYCDLQAQGYLKWAVYLLIPLQLLFIFTDNIMGVTQKFPTLILRLITALCIFLLWFISQRKIAIIRIYNAWFFVFVILIVAQLLSLKYIHFSVALIYSVSIIWLCASFLTFFQPIKQILLVLVSLLISMYLLTYISNNEVKIITKSSNLILLVYSALASFSLSVLTWNRNYKEWKLFSKIKNQRENLKKLNDEIQKDIDLAKDIQNRALPQELNPHAKIKIAYEYIPAAGVSGDILDVFEINEHLYGVFLADVAGHGIAPALISSMLKMSLSSLENRYQIKPKRLLEKVNNLMYDQLQREYITMVYAVLDTNSGKLTYATAGHEAPIIIRNITDKVIYDKPKGTALGIRKVTQFNEKTVKLQKGDLVYFFSDGCFELFNADNKLMEFSKFMELVQRHSSSAIDNILPQLMESLQKENNYGNFEDDLSILALQFGSN